jgi:hypothetical protein
MADPDDHAVTECFEGIQEFPDLTPVSGIGCGLDGYGDWDASQFALVRDFEADATTRAGHLVAGRGVVADVGPAAVRAGERKSHFTFLLADET